MLIYLYLRFVVICTLCLEDPYSQFRLLSSLIRLPTVIFVRHGNITNSDTSVLTADQPLSTVLLDEMI